MAKFPAGGRGPRSGELGRCRAAPGGPLHPLGRRAGVSARRGAGSRPGQPQLSKAPPRAYPGLAEAHEPPRPPAQRPAPPGPRSHRPRSARLPPQACHRPPAPLRRWSSPPTCGAGSAGRAGGGRTAPDTGGGRTAGSRRGAAGGGAASVPSRPVSPVSAAGGVGLVPRGGRGAGVPAVPLAAGRRAGGCGCPAGLRLPARPPRRRKAREWHRNPPPEREAVLPGPRGRGRSQAPVEVTHHTAPGERRCSSKESYGRFGCYQLFHLLSTTSSMNLTMKNDANVMILLIELEIRSLREIECTY
ncbi:uncharacterized protein [Ciconia boyciana]|uniref:uncharacterized protein n=1 Tax=Ciconia boyciana TaxID=52775 RepID=UPI003B9E148C